MWLSVNHTVFSQHDIARFLVIFGSRQRMLIFSAVLALRIFRTFKPILNQMMIYLLWVCQMPMEHSVNIFQGLLNWTCKRDVKHNFFAVDWEQHFRVIDIWCGITWGTISSSADHRPLQKRERTGKEYGCFLFAWKTNMFKWKIN